MRKLFYAGAIALLLAPAPAPAGELADSFTAGVWSGGRLAGQRHCTADARFTNKAGLYVTIMPDGEFRLGVSYPRWNLPPGKQYPVTLTLDGTWSFEGYGTVAAEEPQLVAMIPPKKFAGIFQDAKVLAVSVAGDSFAFALHDMDKLVQALFECQKPQAFWHMTEVVDAHKICLLRQIADIAPHSNESARTLVLVIMTKCRKEEEAAIEVTLQVFPDKRPIETREMMEEETSKTLLADIVTFRAGRASGRPQEWDKPPLINPPRQGRLL